MATNNIENIYFDYRTATEYPPDYTLDFFKKNSILFGNLTALKDEEELKLYCELVYQNLSALYQKGRFNDTVDTAKKSLKFIDIEKERLRLTKFDGEWYNGLLSFQAMALYNLRDYKASTTIFRQLADNDKKNENYKNWLSYSLYGQRMWISKTIMVLCGALILIGIFFKGYIPSFFVRMSLDSIALIGLVGTAIYDYYIKRSFRKTKQK
jgi:hypothetical protein